MVVRITQDVPHLIHAVPRFELVCVLFPVGIFGPSFSCARACACCRINASCLLIMAAFSVGRLCAGSSLVRAVSTGKRMSTPNINLKGLAPLLGITAALYAAAMGASILCHSVSPLQ